MVRRRHLSAETRFGVLKTPTIWGKLRRGGCLAAPFSAHANQRRPTWTLGAPSTRAKFRRRSRPPSTGSGVDPFHVLQRASHLHLPIPHSSGGEMLLRFLLGPCATRQFREREMTMREERPHAEFVGQVERLAVGTATAVVGNMCNRFIAVTSRSLTSRRPPRVQ